MLEATREALAFVVGRTRLSLDEDRLLALALVRELEIIGEAASQVSPGQRSALTEIPWAQIIGMRNRLAHAYFSVDLDRIWDTVTDDLPPLVAAPERALAD